MALDPKRKKAIIEELKSRNVDVSKYTTTETEENVVDTDTANFNFIDALRDPDDYMDAPKQTIRSKKISNYLTSPQFARLVLEISAGVAGSILAPQFSVPLLVGKAAAKVAPVLKMAVTRMAGAGIGEGSGALVSQTFDPSFDSKSDFNEIAEEITKDVLKKGAIGATGEGAGQLIGKVVTKVLSKNKKLIQGAEEAVETIDAQKAKILKNPKSYSQEVKDAVNVGQLTPGLLQKGQTIDILEGVAESSLLGGGSIRYAKDGANTIAQSGIDDFVKIYKSKAGDDELGILFQKILTDDVNAFKGVAKIKYKAVDKVLSTKKFADNFQVDFTKTKAAAQKELDNLGFKQQNAPLRTFLTDILSEPNYISFSKANTLRGDALEITRDFTTETLGKKKARQAAITADNITKAMENSPVPDSVKKLLSDANKHYREGAEVFNLPLFKKIIDSDPDLVYKSIVAAGDRPTLINKTFEILDKRITDITEKKFLKNKIRGEFLEDIMTKSQIENNQFGVEVDAGKLFKNFTKKQKTFKAMFSNQEIKEFEKFQNSLRFAQGRKSKVGGLPGPMMIQMKQSGAILELGGLLGVGTGFTGAGASILLGPWAIAKVFTTPKIVKALTLGFKYSDNPSISRRYLLQTLTYMSQEDIISNDDLKEMKNEIKQIEKENSIIGDQSSTVSESFILNENKDNITSEPNTVSQTLPTPQLQTPGINENLLAQATQRTAGTQPSGITASGLTPTELGLLSPEEQAIRLRSRGMA
tara:strand:+ start:1155 stop:3425 length:2271 start_codon:yes stop_codon:yes gene_type:complete